MLKNPVSANYKTKNTGTFQLFHCQQTQSLLITLYYIIIIIIGTIRPFPSVNFAKLCGVSCVF
jgi:hypothetical protein